MTATLPTGRLRKFIPSMLGPSDVRKNINRLMPVKERCQQLLKFLSDYRLPVGISRADALRLLQGFVAGDSAALPDRLKVCFRRLSLEQVEGFRSFLAIFLRYFFEQEGAGRTFDFTDCALGNLLFAGCYLEQGEDFNRTVDASCRFYEVAPGTLLNVTRGENLFLVAQKDDGSMLLGEADIVAAQSSAKITRLYLLDGQVYRTGVEDAPAPAGGQAFRKREQLTLSQFTPVSLAWIAALAAAYLAGIVLTGLLTIAVDMTRYNGPAYPLVLAVTAPLISIALKGNRVMMALILVGSILAIHSRSLAQVLPTESHIWAQRTLDTEVEPGTTAGAWLLGHLPADGVIVAVNGQAVEYVLHRDVVAAIVPRSTQRIQSEQAYRRLMTHYRSRYLVLFPGLSSDVVPEQEAIPFLRQLSTAGAPVPAWLRVAAANRVITIYECASCAGQDLHVVLKSMMSE